MSTTNKQRIALVISSFKVGGAEINRVRLANMLVNNGYEVDFVVRKLIGSLESSLDKRVSVYSLNADRVRNSIFPLISYISSRKPDAILTAMWPLTVISVIAVALVNYSPRVILSEHTTLSKTPAASNILSRIMLRLSVGLCYQFADSIIAVSQGVADDLKSISFPKLNKNVSVIYNSFDNHAVNSSNIDNQMSPEDCDDSFIKYIAVGNLKPAKDYQTLLMAFRIVNSKRPAKLVIVGSGPEEQYLKKLTDQLSLGSCVSFVGHINNPIPLIAKNDVLVLSSRWEGFPNVLVEAMSQGVQVVSTNCDSGPSEILDNGRYGLLSPVGDFNQLATNMLMAVDNPVDVELLKKGAGRFSGQRFLEGYLAAIFGK